MYFEHSTCNRRKTVCEFYISKMIYYIDQKMSVDFVNSVDHTKETALYRLLGYRAQVSLFKRNILFLLKHFIITRRLYYKNRCITGGHQPLDPRALDPLITALAPIKIFKFIYTSILNSWIINIFIVN